MPAIAQLDGAQRELDREFPALLVTGRQFQGLVDHRALAGAAKRRERGQIRRLIALRGPQPMQIPAQRLMRRITKHSRGRRIPIADRPRRIPHQNRVVRRIGHDLEALLRFP